MPMLMLMDINKLSIINVVYNFHGYISNSWTHNEHFRGDPVLGRLQHEFVGWNRGTNIAR